MPSLLLFVLCCKICQLPKNAYTCSDFRQFCNVKNVASQCIRLPVGWFLPIKRLSSANAKSMLDQTSV